MSLVANGRTLNVDRGLELLHAHVDRDSVRLRDDAEHEHLESAALAAREGLRAVTPPARRADPHLVLQAGIG